MKKLTGLDDQIINLIDEKSPEVMPTFRKLLKIALGNLPPKSADEGLELNQILLKLRQVEAVIDVESHEMKTILEKVGENKVGLPQISAGQLMAYLKACDKASDEKK